MGHITAAKRRDRVNPVDYVVVLKRVKSTLILLSLALILINISYLRSAPIKSQVEFVKQAAPVEENILTYDRPGNAPLVAIVSCIKQTGHHQPAKDIERSLLASIYATVTQLERASYRVELILGYDHDDEYWQEEENHHLSPTKTNGEIMYKNHEPIPVNFVSIRKDPNGDHPNRIPFNELCQAAYDYGAKYIVRINDDSEFASTGWITKAVNVLGSFHPPNVGVVGPTCHEGNTDIMTHDMVHAPAHYSMFDTYYPIEFDNWYVDDWMTLVYGKERTKQLEDWVIIHHLNGTRYEPAVHQGMLLNQAVAEGLRVVERETSKMNGEDPNGNRYRKRDELRVLGTDIIQRVDGPMQKLHLSLLNNPKTPII